MSDIDDETAGIFEHASFFEWEFAKYKRNELMNPKFGAQERLNLYAEGIEKMHENPKVPQLFRNIFKHAFLPFRDPGILDRFLKQVNEFQYEHSEDLWDAFEYLLGCLNAAWDAWMFRTPRHIIDFIVSAVNPQFWDTILDPACGTAWFLISAFKHIVSQNPQAKNKIAELSPKFVGYDISPNMVQLALVNLYLHQFPDPKIFEYDTLTYEDHRGEKFDCILANPPFMTPKGWIQPHNRFSVQSKKAEVLFVDYIIEHLKQNWKWWVIVPDWVVWTKWQTYNTIRKNLLDNWLWCVVSLHQSVFKPYAWAKTSILFFDKRFKNNDKVLFTRMENDWYSLWEQRIEINKNDIPELKKLMTHFKTSIEKDTEFLLTEDQKQNARIESKKTIIETWCYDLFPNYYINKNLEEKYKFSLKPFSSIFNVEKWCLQSSKAEEWDYPFITASKERLNNIDYSHDQEALIFAMWASGSLWRVHYVSGKFIASDLCFILTPKHSGTNLKFWFYYLNSMREVIVKATARWSSKLSINDKNLWKLLLPIPDDLTQWNLSKYINTTETRIGDLKKEINFLEEEMYEAFRKNLE